MLGRKLNDLSAQYLPFYSDKTYQVEAKLQTFDAHTNPERILIHAVDLDRGIVVKRWVFLETFSC